MPRRRLSPMPPASDESNRPPSMTTPKPTVSSSSHESSPLLPPPQQITTTTTTTKQHAPRKPSITSPLPELNSKLLTIHDIPAWYGDNPYILTSYRPIFSSVTPCFKSWLYLHNQTANIYTHLLPGLLTLVLNGVLVYVFQERYPDATFWDRAVFHVYLTACTLCFGTSAAYHTLLCHSREYADLWVRLDYVCISVLILGSFVPGLYMGFYCEPLLLRGYLTMILALGIYNIYSSMQQQYADENWVKARLLPFIAMGMSAFVPVIHAAFLFPYDQLQAQAGLNYYYLEGVLMVTGSVFLATKFPECWLPGRFDVLGGSHQIFHVFVVLGTVAHFAGITSGYDWNYNNPRC